MKRSFFYFAVSALALTACTSEEVLDDAVKTGKAIRFENVVNKHSRQGDVKDLSGTGLTQFQVYGYYTTDANTKIAFDVFKNDVVTKLDNGTWSYPGELRYWVPGARYYFYAYSCGEASETDEHFGTFSLDMDSELEPGERVPVISEFVCDASHQHDLIYASNTGAIEGNKYAGILAKDNANPAVTLAFRHLLTKVNATFACDFPSGYNVTISDVTIENIRNCGDYNTDTEKWEKVIKRDGAAHVYLLDTNDTNVAAMSLTPGAGAKKTHSAYVIPDAYTVPGEGENAEPVVTNVYLKFNVVVTNNDGVTVLDKEMTASFSPSWESGYTYTYNVVVDASALDLGTISFSTSVSDWTEEKKPSEPSENE